MTVQSVTPTKQIVMYAWSGDDVGAESSYVYVALDSSAVAELWKAKDTFEKAWAVGARRMDIEYGGGDVLFLSDCDVAEDDKFHEVDDTFVELIGEWSEEDEPVGMDDLWLQVDETDFCWIGIEHASGCRVRSKYVPWTQLAKWQAEIEAGEEALPVPSELQVGGAT